MNAKRSTPRASAIASILAIAAVFLTACSGILPEKPNVPPAEAYQACAVGAPEAVVIDGRRWNCADLVNAPPAGPAATSAGPGATAPVSVAPTAAPLPAGTVLDPLQWTDWVLDNVVIPNATVVRPTRPFEGQVPEPNTDVVFQLKTDLDDTNPSATWKGGQLIYEYDVPGGWRPVFLGAQGDTSIMLCWQAEEKDGNASTKETQVLMRTQTGNGASALVRFERTDTRPDVGVRCSASG